MEIEIKLTVPDELIHFIIQEYEVAHSGKKLNPKNDELKDKLIADIGNRLKMKVSKDLQTKFKKLFLPPTA